jgi:hypothetical protein
MGQTVPKDTIINVPLINTPECQQLPEVTSPSPREEQGADTKLEFTGRDGAPVAMAQVPGGPDVTALTTPIDVEDGVDTSSAPIDEGTKTKKIFQLDVGDHSIGTTYTTSELLMIMLLSKQNPTTLGDFLLCLEMLLTKL